MPPDVFLVDNIRRICVSGTIHHKYLPDTWVFALKKCFSRETLGRLFPYPYEAMAELGYLLV